MALLSTQAQAKYILRRSHDSEEKDEEQEDDDKKKKKVVKRGFVSREIFEKFCCRFVVSAAQFCVDQ